MTTSNKSSLAISFLSFAICVSALSTHQLGLAQGKKSTQLGCDALTDVQKTSFENFIIPEDSNGPAHPRSIRENTDKHSELNAFMLDDIRAWRKNPQLFFEWVAWSFYFGNKHPALKSNSTMKEFVAETNRAHFTNFLLLVEKLSSKQRTEYANEIAAIATLGFQSESLSESSMHRAVRILDLMLEAPRGLTPIRKASLSLAKLTQMEVNLQSKASLVASEYSPESFAHLEGLLIESLDLVHSIQNLGDQAISRAFEFEGFHAPVDPFLVLQFGYTSGLNVFISDWPTTFPSNTEVLDRLIQITMSFSRPFITESRGLNLEWYPALLFRWLLRKTEVHQAELTMPNALTRLRASLHIFLNEELKSKIPDLEPTEPSETTDATEPTQSDRNRLN